MQLYFSAIALLAGAASAQILPTPRPPNPRPTNPPNSEPFALEGDDFFDGSAVVAAAHAKLGAAAASFSRYPRVLELDLPYKSSTLELRLEANTALFSADWSAASWDDASGELVIETNPEDYMCHYLGSVVGMPDSVVALSVCSDIGIQGRIVSSDAGLDLGVHATDMSLRSITNVGKHAIYNMTDLEGIDFGEVDNEIVDDGGAMLGPQNDVAADDSANARSRYMNNAIFVSSRQRLQQFSSNSQERSSTQSAVNTALSYYLDRDSRWNGDSPRHAIRAQEQNPSGYDQSSGNPIEKCRSYKSSRWNSADNLQCLRVSQSGEPAGEAWVGSMCGSYSVGWNSSGGNQRSMPVVIAHEMGHNYGFQHENRGVMMAAVQYEELYFAGNAVNEWSRRRDNYGCLR